ncbi:MAG TPA: hAT transposon family protein [Stellaceae bacterium]|nr:hAT transposon family protein [Stellaceae bacterium]
MEAEAGREKSDLLKELKTWRKRGPVGKLHNIIIFICRSPQRREKFAKIPSYNDGQTGEYDHLSLVVDNATRWNSLYSMIERAVKLRGKIDQFCIDHAEIMHGSSTRRARSDDDYDALLKNDALTGDDWLTLNEVLKFLQPFYVLTKRAEGTKLTGDRGVLSDYMTTLNSLLKHVREARDELDVRAADPCLTTQSTEFLRTCVLNCWTKLDGYFSLVNETPAHYASVVTIPHMKWKYFQHNWKDAHTWKDAVNPRSWLPEGKKALYSVWDEYKDLPTPPSTAGSKRARSPDEFELDNDMTLLDDDVFNDELATWLSMKPFKLEPDEPLPAFWLRQLKNPSTYRLARMGVDMVGIPAMSSDCERVFSQCKLLITGQRNRLKSDIIEATQCLRMWMIMERKAAGTWKGKGNWAVPLELYNSTDYDEEVKGEVVEVVT